MRRAGIYAVPYPVATRLSYVDLADVAEVAALVLSQPGHIGATYELAGTLATSQEEVAAILSRQLGRPVRAEEIPLGRWQEESQLAGYALETLLAMFRYYATCGLAGNPTVLRALLGRPPATLAEFVARQARDSA